MSATPGADQAKAKDVEQSPTGERPGDPHEGAPPPTEQLEDNSVESGTPSKGS